MDDDALSENPVWLPSTAELPSRSEFVSQNLTTPRLIPLGEEEADCPVCYRDMRYLALSMARTNLPVRLPCAGRHAFCQECLLEWLDTKDSCPMCREVILNDDPGWPGWDVFDRRLASEGSVWTVNGPVLWGFTAEWVDLERTEAALVEDWGDWIRPSSDRHLLRDENVSDSDSDAFNLPRRIVRRLGQLSVNWNPPILSGFRGQFRPQGLPRASRLTSPSPERESRRMRSPPAGFRGRFRPQGLRPASRLWGSNPGRASRHIRDSASGFRGQFRPQGLPRAFRLASPSPERESWHVRDPAAVFRGRFRPQGLRPASHLGSSTPERASQHMRDSPPGFRGQFRPQGLPPASRLRRSSRETALRRIRDTHPGGMISEDTRLIWPARHARSGPNSRFPPQFRSGSSGDLGTRANHWESTVHFVQREQSPPNSSRLSYNHEGGNNSEQMQEGDGHAGDHLRDSTDVTDECEHGTNTSGDTV